MESQQNSATTSEKNCITIQIIPQNMKRKNASKLFLGHQNQDKDTREKTPDNLPDEHRCKNS